MTATNIPKLPPVRMHVEDRNQLRDWAYAAQRLLPPSIAKLVARELDDAAEFGYRLGAEHLARGLVADLADLRRKAAQG